MEPAAIRTKNPGAMWPGPIATKWGSKEWVYLNDGTGQGGGGRGNKIAIFDNWVGGICAQLDLWRSSPKYRNQPFAVAIDTWCGHNHTESYIAYVLKRVPTMTRNTIMNDVFWRSASALAFLKAQAAHEAGKQIPAPDSDWITAQKRVMGGSQPAVKSTSTAVAVNTTTTTVATQAAKSGASMTQILLIILVGLVITGFGVWWFHFRKRPAKPEEVAIQGRNLPLDVAVEMALAAPKGDK